MRVLLLQPPLLPAAEVTPPLGLTTLASWLAARGHEPRILDLDLEVRERASAAEDRYVPLFERTLADFAPDVCAVTSMYSNSLQAEHLVRAAKRCRPEIVTVTGGAHFGALNGALDVERYVRTIPSGSARRIVYIEAGRGCPFACTFCATAPFWRRQFRVKPAARIVDEIRYLHERHGYDSFMLVHDLLTVSRKFMEEFCDAMLEAKLPVEWMANSRIDIRLKGLLPKMKAAGCWKLFFGVESASARVQEVVDKHLDPADAGTTVAELSAHGISCTCSFVLGQPDERPEELSETIALGARLKLLGAETVQFHRLRMWPPAPITHLPLPVEFDLDSLRIEYPFPQVPAEHVAAIRADNSFFSGYFVPETTAGTPMQLAQVEMFFHHAVTLAPYTVAALGQLARGALVPAFYAALAEVGPLRREELTWDAALPPHANWRTLRPLFAALISRHAGLSAEERSLALGLFGYEEWRLHVTHGVPTPEPAAAGGANWSAYLSPLDLAQAIERLRSGDELTGDLLVPGILILAREPGGGFASYELDADQLPELNRPDSELVRELSAVN